MESDVALGTVDDFDDHRVACMGIERWPWVLPVRGQDVLRFAKPSVRSFFDLEDKEAAGAAAATAWVEGEAKQNKKKQKNNKETRQENQKQKKTKKKAKKKKDNQKRQQQKNRNHVKAPFIAQRSRIGDAHLLGNMLSYTNPSEEFSFVRSLCVMSSFSKAKGRR